MQDLRTLGNLPIKHAQKTHPHDESPVRLAVHTFAQSNQFVKRGVFTRDFSHVLRVTHSKKEEVELSEMFCFHLF